MNKIIFRLYGTQLTVDGAATLCLPFDLAEYCCVVPWVTVSTGWVCLRPLFVSLIARFNDFFLSERSLGILDSDSIIFLVLASPGSNVAVQRSFHLLKVLAIEATWDVLSTSVA